MQKTHCPLPFTVIFVIDNFLLSVNYLFHPVVSPENVSQCPNRQNLPCLASLRLSEKPAALRAVLLISVLFHDLFVDKLRFRVMCFGHFEYAGTYEAFCASLCTVAYEI